MNTNKLIQRLQSFLWISEDTANERLSHMLIELRHRRIVFDVAKAEENGQTIYFAKSQDYPAGSIMAAGKDPNELEQQIKNAIFTAFDIPAKFCNPDLIALSGESISENTIQAVYATT